MPAGTLSIRIDNMEQTTPLGRLAEILQEITRASEQVPDLVKRARMNGATWEQIGQSLGVSRQAAWAAYHHKMGYEFPAGPES